MCTRYKHLMRAIEILEEGETTMQQGISKPQTSLWIYDA